MLRTQLARQVAATRDVTERTFCSHASSRPGILGHPIAKVSSSRPRQRDSSTLARTPLPRGEGIRKQATHVRSLSRCNYSTAPLNNEAKSVESDEEHAARIERELMALPLVRDLLDTPDVAIDSCKHPKAGESMASVPSMKTMIRSEGSNSSFFDVYRPYKDVPAEKLKHHMTAGQLRGPGRFAIPPLAIIRNSVRAGNDRETSSSKSASSKSEAAAASMRMGDAYVFFHLGRSLCGHEGIIHGGLVATLCDEALAVTGFRRFASRVGVTVRLEIDYKSPAYPDRFIVAETRLVIDEGQDSVQASKKHSRKSVVQGTIKDAHDGRVLAEARAIFVEPRAEAGLGAKLSGSANASSA